MSIVIVVNSKKKKIFNGQKGSVHFGVIVY